ncbi:hypothetical protein C8R46DRAFT_1292155 [Mycena filopes]|nr:hypothetical protein C8R46DRAFT_1292155 [Mycena filopes]
MPRKGSLQSNVDSEPLLPFNSDTGINDLPNSKESKWLKLIILIQFGLIAGLLVVLASLPGRLPCLDGPRALDGRTALYSPAQDAIEHQVVKFGSDGIFQAPPSDEVDAAWENLYQFGISSIPKDQAALLPNKTFPLSFNTTEYIIQLEIFHQLHCLNQIRKGVHRDYYSPANTSTNPLLTPPHLAHCFNFLRQSLMCAADISPLVWQWNPTVQTAEIHFDIVHSCRNFDKISDWARARHVRKVPNFREELKDDIVIPGF